MKTGKTLLIAALFLGFKLVAAEPSVPAGSTGEAAVKARVELEIQKRVKELIDLINLEPNLLMVNPNAQVVKDADWKPVTADGKYNQDYKVVPDDTKGPAGQALMVEHNRQRWADELVMIGQPAVDQLRLAVIDEGKKYRSYYVYALGQIKDLRACPALLKYYSDGVEAEKAAKSLEKLGALEDAAKLRQESAQKRTESVNALKTISGKDLGDDYGKWDQWWKETEKKIGPVPMPKLFAIKGVKEDRAESNQTNSGSTNK
jgi:hypothetical protein